MSIVFDTPAPTRYSAKYTTKPISFFCAAPEAESAYLMGDFNDWSPTSHPMEWRKDGWWYLQVPLTHGYHEYLFVVDGVPTLDPHATGTTRNARYEKVSLIAVS
jgi:1,4-alpha-glucan branching enzyme